VYKNKVTEYSQLCSGNYMKGCPTRWV